MTKSVEIGVKLQTKTNKTFIKARYWKIVPVVRMEINNDIFCNVVQ